MSEESNFADEFENLKRRFGGKTIGDLRSGSWIFDVVRWVLESHARNATADYVRARYPGAGVENRARKLTQMVARSAGLVGGLSGAAVSGLELSSLGPQVAITLPAAVACVGADLALTTRLQLRAAFDLSVIHGAPLDVDDPDDCYFILMSAMGVKLGESAADFVRAAGASAITYNMRKLLRSGLRRALVEALKRVVGQKLAQKVTEKAVMRLLLPGINIPLSYGLNYAFTRAVLRVANRQMRRRGAVLAPLVDFYRACPDIPQVALPAGLVVLLSSPVRDGWPESQMQALRHTQSALSLSDERVQELDAWFGRSVQEFIAYVAAFPSNAPAALVRYLVVAAAVDPDDTNDKQYSVQIEQVARHFGVPFQQVELAQERKRLDK